MDDEKKEKKEEKKHFSDYLATFNNRTPHIIDLNSRIHNAANQLTPSPFTDKQIQPPDPCC